MSWRPSSEQAISDTTFRSGRKAFITEICYMLQELPILLIVARRFVFANLSCGVGGDPSPEGRPNVSTLSNNGN
jgi:hypothetical protein